MRYMRLRCAVHPAEVVSTSVVECYILMHVNMSASFLWQQSKLDLSERWCTCVRFADRCSVCVCWRGGSNVIFKQLFRGFPVVNQTTPVVCRDSVSAPPPPPPRRRRPHCHEAYSLVCQHNQPQVWNASHWITVQTPTRHRPSQVSKAKQIESRPSCLFAHLVGGDRVRSDIEMHPHPSHIHTVVRPKRERLLHTGS